MKADKGQTNQRSAISRITRKNYSTKSNFFQHEISDYNFSALQFLSCVSVALVICCCHSCPDPLCCRASSQVKVGQGKAGGRYRERRQRVAPSRGGAGQQREALDQGGAGQGSSARRRIAVGWGKTVGRSGERQRRKAPS